MPLVEEVAAVALLMLLVSPGPFDMLPVPLDAAAALKEPLGAPGAGSVVFSALVAVAVVAVAAAAAMASITSLSSCRPESGLELD